MRVRYENEIIVCIGALVKNRDILFCTYNNEFYITNFPSNIDANEAFKLLFTQGHYVVSNFKHIDASEEKPFIDYMLRKD